jgi:release factor glutamine methyltransferase
MVARRVAGEPLEVILGWAEFAGRRVLVEPGVFVPRRRTEVLVRQALLAAARVPGYPETTAIALELCAGVGAVAAALASAGLQSYAAELDPVAAGVARRNLAPDHVFEGDLYAPLPETLRGGIDILIANAPYVPSAEIPNMPPEAREHEPLLALDGGADGLDVQRRVIAGARDWLSAGGVLLIETSRRQADRTVALMRDAGLDAHWTHDDELDGTAAVGRISGS